MFIDTHCHISKNDYSDIDKLIKENKESGVEKIIVSVDQNGIDEAFEFLEKYEGVYISFGYHPCDANVITDEHLERLESLLVWNKKIVALGEIGLDYYWVSDNKVQQIELFRKQLEIAKRHNFPVIIHSRNATEDTICILKELFVPGVIHCFSGSLETAKAYIKMGYKLGIGGVITFKNSKLKEVIKEIPLENIVLETDAPYLTPEPFRGKQNSSKYIPVIAEYIASIKHVSVNEVMNITANTAKELFDLL